MNEVILGICLLVESFLRFKSSISIARRFVFAGESRISLRSLVADFTSLAFAEPWFSLRSISRWSHGPDCRLVAHILILCVLLVYWFHLRRQATELLLSVLIARSCLLYVPKPLALGRGRYLLLSGLCSLNCTTNELQLVFLKPEVDWLLVCRAINELSSLRCLI
jgi:hypothetical protein